MTKKTKVIIGLIGAVVVMALPIVYQKFNVPQSTQDTIFGFIIGMVSQYGLQAAARVAKPKGEKQDG